METLLHDKTAIALLLIHSIFMIIVTMFCISKARDLNRSQLNWGVLGFVFPLLAIIWIQFMKNKIAWPESKYRAN